MLELIARIEAHPRLARKLLEEYANRDTFPRMQGDTAVFFFWDDKPADAVYLQHWVFGLTSRVEFQRIGKTNAWYLFLDLPKTARVEYKLVVHRDVKDWWMQDPRNPRAETRPVPETAAAPVAAETQAPLAAELPA